MADDGIRETPFGYFDALVMGWGYARQHKDEQTAAALRQLLKKLCAGEFAEIDVFRAVVIDDPQKCLDYTDKASA